MSVPDKHRWRVLSPHLDRALELSGHERALWLASLRAEDAALATDVEALLDEHGVLEREGFLAGVSPSRPAPASPAGLANPPDRIGAYRILRELGRGGMGCVYLAEQEGEGFRRLVALKVVEPGSVGAGAERRFRDERRILAGLEHPGIARFYDAGRSSDGRWFLALEYVEGLNLLEHARRREVPTEERVRLFLEVLEAVEFAHGRSIVHRDLKPSNILIGADGRPRLLDFGIAKLLDPGSDASSVTETRTELRALTPAYASPEQFRGDPVTPSSDVFSLGVMLYELVAGFRPFAATSTSRAALEQAVLTEDPDPPSTASRKAQASRRPLTARAGVAFRPKATRLGRDLDAICLKALRREPNERYATVAAFAQDLRAALEGRPVAARTGRHRYRMTRFARRHRGGLAAASALVLAGVAVIATASYRHAEQASAPPTPRAFPLYGFDRTPIAELERRFAASPAGVEAGAGLALALTINGRAQEAQLIVARLRQIPGREQDPLTDYAEARIYQSTEPQRALVLFTRARDRALADGRGELVGEVRSRRGYLLSRMGDRAAARAEMELARADLERAGDRRALIPLLNDLATEYLHEGRMAEGEALLEKVLAEVVSRNGVRAGNTIRLNLALVAGQRGRPDLAEPRQRQVMEQRRGSASPRMLAEVMHDLADTLHDLGRTREADPLLDEAIALLRKNGPPSSLVETLFSRGAIDVDRAGLDRIAETVREMEAAARAEGAKASLGLAHDLQGRVAAARGDLASARRHLSEGSRLLVDTGDLDRAGEIDLVWAAVEHAAGNPAVALRLADGARARLGERGAGLPVGFFAAVLHARIDAESGRADDARRRLKALGEGLEHSPSVRRRLAFLGARVALARAEGRFDDARRDLESARDAAEQADRKLDFLSLRLELAELELGSARGGRQPALAAAESVRREAAARGLGALVARVRRLGAVTGTPAPPRL